MRWPPCMRKRHCRRTDSSSFRYKGSDGIFYEVVVDIDPTVIHVSRQSWQQRVCICKGLPNSAFRKYLRIEFHYPFFQLLYNRIGFFLAYLCSLFRWHILTILLYSIIAETVFYCHFPLIFSRNIAVFFLLSLLLSAISSAHKQLCGCRLLRLALTVASFFLCGER